MMRFPQDGNSGGGGMTLADLLQRFSGRSAPQGFGGSPTGGSPMFGGVGMRNTAPQSPSWGGGGGGGFDPNGQSGNSMQGSQFGFGGDREANPVAPSQWGGMGGAPNTSAPQLGGAFAGASSMSPQGGGGYNGAPVDANGMQNLMRLLGQPQQGGNPFQQGGMRRRF